jgi:hypothetical protein
MVVLLRTQGIEARNVNGFLGGEWSQFGDYLAVTQNQAHSWVEVWFPQYGWVTFDPTPSGGGGGERLESWFWPGRILFDAIQHRWSKWVLDYDVKSQTGIFRRWSRVVAPVTEGRRGSRQDPEGRPVPWGVAMLLAVLLAAAWWARRGRRRVSRETRLYLRLRATCERAGIPVPPGLTPLALVDRVRQAHGNVAHSAERVVDLYLRARYGGETLGESELREMSAALGAVRRNVRKAT